MLCSLADFKEHPWAAQLNMKRGLSAVRTNAVRCLPWGAVQSTQIKVVAFPTEPRGLRGVGPRQHRKLRDPISGVKRRTLCPAGLGCRNRRGNVFDITPTTFRTPQASKSTQLFHASPTHLRKPPCARWNKSWSQC